jgi:hypothetical protein
MTSPSVTTPEPPSPPPVPGTTPLTRPRGFTGFALAFLAGLASGVVLWSVVSGPGSWKAPTTPGSLPAPVLAVLQSLREPITVHFYVGLEDPAVPEQDRTFARHVEEFLARLSNASPRVRIIRHEVRSPEDQAAAARAGLQAFHLERGAAAFLGLVLEGPGGQRVIPRLDPFWEPALPFDLARALAEVGPTPPPVTAPPAPDEQEVLAGLRQTLGDPESVGVHEGATRLREATLEEFRRTAQSFQLRQEELQQRFREAEQRGDTAAQQAVLEELRQLQAEQTAQLQPLAQRLQAQLELWQKLKTSPGTNAPTSAPSAIPQDARRPHR